MSATPAPKNDSRITVMYIIWSLQMGGAERVVADTALRLDRTRFRPIVACLNFKGRLAEDLEAEGIEVFAFDKKPNFDATITFRLAKLMRDQKVDVVHPHLWTSSFWGRMAAVIARVPVIVITEHDLDKWRSKYHLLADRILGYFTKHWIFVSHGVQEFYCDYLKLTDDRYTVVHNGIGVEQFEQSIDAADVKKRMGIPEGKKILGVIGRLDPRKGHCYFMEAMKSLTDKHPDVMGIIVGQGAQMEALQAQQKELGLEDKVKLIGYWESLAEAQAVVDVFVLPSLMEGHPLAVLEAMAASKPVVSTRVGGTHEAVAHGETGLLVEAKDVPALEAAMTELITDLDHAREMGRLGRAKLDREFSLQAAVNSNQDIYLQYLDGAGKSGQLASDAS
ncbi:MAG: glycosyltransferase [Pseudomonadales bacterium]